ncbi:MAG: tRNA (N6-isopentenyl adenosine(37)-C2)-methylthiotransferase MiaB [Thermoguttaceae bacterium]|nr:tRNA (N6-isopentenyl adenosine(37)-C2)-methylthiotransferase MiaB [Thermoguttaceae bacterium]MDW8037800.1 tRNA (N6-isopentenyl adenosine(37)-C2)-methylthiotransferase MiaB [Thermoguttaceae bacterium]
MPKRVYIYTVGCQMNQLDSQLVADLLDQHGYQVVGSVRQADVILFNTCSVRQHAEEKIYSLLGRLKHLKRQYPEKIIGVLGCMAQKDGEAIFRRAAHVDLVVGPGRLARLPELLAQAAAGTRPLLAISPWSERSDRQTLLAGFEPFDPPRRPQHLQPPFQAYVRIMSGCNKVCSYCVVPRVRGPERCRPPEEIHEEVSRLADAGCLEVTLLGQTVNSYQYRSGGRTIRLADLLSLLHQIEGIRRIRFVTNHPRHMSDDLLQAVRDLPKVCPCFHVPAQSGSNTVLRRMQRGYTVEFYREMLARIRQTVPEASITSDFIVGFCGETEEDFQQTVQLVEEARFKNAYIFKYSPRPGTKAAELYPDDVPLDVKRRRNHQLLQLQNRISLEENQKFIGRQVEVLVEGPSKFGQKAPQTQSSVQLTGRTPCERIVVFPGDRGLVGQFHWIRITGATPTTLLGQLEQHPIEVASCRLERGNWLPVISQ